MTNAYDAFPYLSQAYAETHPDRLYTLAHLFALDPHPVESARVLDVGCADGANLVPMAEALPNATFVGVDLSAEQIRLGMERVEPLGLGNLELLHGDFTDLDDETEPFDYVLMHGVLSWVPPRSRAGLLTGIKERLSPNGVAYISYNCSPGFHFRGVLRDFLRLHIAGLAPDQAVGRARQMLTWLLESSSTETDEGRIRRKNCQRMIAAPDGYLLHGLLADHNHPLYFKDFLEECGSAGMGYLGDADFGSMLSDRLYEQARTGMESAPGGLEEHEQIHDFLIDRSFRRSLLVHADQTPERSIPWERAESLWVSGNPRLVAGKIEDGEDARFDCDGMVFSTDDPVIEHGLAALAAQWPGNLGFSEWVAETSRRSRCGGVVTRATLGRNLLYFFGRDIVRLGPRDLKAASGVAEKPCTTRWARRRVELGLPVTDLRHGMRTLPRIPLALLPALDGTRDHRALAKELNTARRHGLVKFSEAPETALHAALEGLRIRSLLVE